MSSIKKEVQACLQQYFESNKHILFNETTGDFEEWKVKDFLGVLSDQLCDWFDIREKPERVRPEEIDDEEIMDSWVSHYVMPAVMDGVAVAIRGFETYGNLDNMMDDGSEFDDWIGDVVDKNVRELLAEMKNQAKKGTNG